jgi:2-polyprenyl-3-methyl-5-hydroxy-6-metoxy-1,4-benzoquinol methylase
MLTEPSIASLQSVNQPCFVCGSVESEIRFRPDVRRWGYLEPFILRACSGCGLIFNSPRLSLEELEGLYRSQYYFFDRPAGAELRRIRGAYLRTMAHLQGVSAARVLEVGSAKGYMLALLSHLGWRVTGVELAETAAAYSRGTFGVEVFHGTLESFRREQMRTFDVVLAQDVIEHVPDPASFLEAARDSLPPGGQLVIDTPNVGGRNVGIVGERWRGFNPFHIYLYDRSTLTSALHRAGFTVRLIGSYNEVEAGISLTRATARPARPASSRLGRLAHSARRARSALRSGLDRVLLPYYLRRAARTVQASPASALDPSCRGDNLVCIGVRCV